MYINNFVCGYEIKKGESKCSRIFRPWDSKSVEKKSNDNSQDCTVSTTTQEDEEIVFMPEEKNIAKSEVNCNSDDNKPSKLKEVLPPFSKIITKCPEKSPNTSLDSCSPIKTSAFRSDVLPKSDLNKFPTNLSLPPSQYIHNAIVYHQDSQTHLSTPDTLLQASPLPADFIQDPYSPLYPEIMQANLAQHLGLPSNDPLLLESLAQGYALEEYARVLNQEQQAKLLAAKKHRPKKYKCPHCDVGFSNNGQLKGHIRIHTGERPFKCDDKECGKTFTRNEELTRHKRIHSGLRPFPCTHCGKRFGRKDHLKKHARTHFQPRGLYAVPVVLPFEAWASGQTNGYQFVPMMY